MALTPELSSAVAAKLGTPVASASPLSGGDINRAFRVTLTDGQTVFVKANERLEPRVFQVEARGLHWLREPGALRIPEVLAVADDASRIGYLVLELLESTRPRADFDEHLGRGLALVHGSHATGFGLDHDNFIGSLPQDNTPAPTWPEFFRERRLLPQFERAARAGRLSSTAVRLFQRLLDRLDALVGEDEPPARLHGDLWGGNLHVGPQGEPCLIDPACYGGHREVDLAMMRLFGGFSERVFAAYDEAHPLQDGHQQRVPLYQLYPLLVHVNLFGGGYAGSVERALGTLV
jgi:fructosamine-3-kinase